MKRYSGNIKGISYESTFPATRKFSCSRCGFCCHAEDIDLGDDEIAQIHEKSGIPADGFSENGRLKRKDGHCIFYRGHSCTIHSFRPKTCRNFPYKVFFEKPDSAYIDICHACPSVLRNSAQNEIDFGELVLSTFDDMEPHLLGFMSQVKQKLKPRLDKAFEVEKVMGWLLQDIQPKAIYERTLGLISGLRPGRLHMAEKILEVAPIGVSVEEFCRRSMELAVKLIDTPHNYIDTKTDQVHSICKEGLSISGKGKIEMRNVDIGESGILKEYLNEFWRKKVVQYELFRHMVHGTCTSSGFYARLLRDTTLLLNFFFMGHGDDAIMEGIMFCDQSVLQICRRLDYG